MIKVDSWIKGIVLVAVGMIVAGCGEKPGGAKSGTDPVTPTLPDTTRVSVPPDSPKLKRLTLGTVQMAQVPVGEVTTPGKVETNPNRISHVVLPVPGRVTGVAAKIGDFVQQGQTLFTLESPDVDAAISSYLQARAVITQARAAQGKAQADADRARDLFEHNAVAQKELINAESLLTQASAVVEQTLASEKQAVRRLEILGVKPGEFGQRLAVRAPISGKVLEMNVVPGEFRNDTSSPLLTIADLSSVWVTADVPETSIRQIQVGERLDVEFAAYPGETFRGQVTQIADVVDPQTRTIKVRAELANGQGRLRPEMFGRIRHSEGTETLPVIPMAAVLQEEGQNVVWRQESPGSFQRIKIQTGARIADQIAVTSGLGGGDVVVIGGVMLLKGN